MKIPQLLFMTPIALFLCNEECFNFITHYNVSTSTEKVPPTCKSKDTDADACADADWYIYVLYEPSFRNSADADADRSILATKILRPCPCLCFGMT